MSTETTPSKLVKPGREEIANIELGHTDVPVSVRWFLLLGFLITITIIPIWQHVRDFRQNWAAWENTAAADRRWSQLLPQVYDVVRLAPDWGRLYEARTWWGRFSALPAAEEIKIYEQAVEDNSVLAELLLSRVQGLLTRFGGTGNEEAWTGRGDWLFYRPDICYLTDGPFLDPVRLRNITRYTDINPDPIPALISFRDQLAARGIELVVMPVPVKPQIYPERLGRRTSKAEAPLQNTSYPKLLERLKDAGVVVFDPASTLMKAAKAAGEVPAYLPTDTHWSPEAMERVSAELATFLRRMEMLLEGDHSRFERRAERVTNQGDIAVMLRLPEDQTRYAPQTVTVQRIFDRSNQEWEPDVTAPVLLLGDSFTNIYSSPDLRWGTKGGLAEHLSAQLGLPLDVIAINAGGSHSTREELATQLRRHYAEFDSQGTVTGRERLADKRVVVYQFASRELLGGNWKEITLPALRQEAVGDADRSPGEATEAGVTLVRGKIAAMSHPPRPGTVPYRDAVITLHLVDAEILDGKPGSVDGEALIYVIGMADNLHTPAATLRPEMSVVLQLRPWSEVESRYGSMQRLDLGTEADFLFPAWWGELTELRKDKP